MEDMLKHWNVIEKDFVKMQKENQKIAKLLSKENQR